MQLTLKVISLLLSYPSIEMQQAIPEIKQALAADPANDEADLQRLLDDIAALDLFDAQERYVFLFDRTRALSLHLFEHVHGESRDRGQAMVNLMQQYEANDLIIDAHELPDYLPLFLEYLSTRPDPEVIELLDQASHIIAALEKRLQKRDSVYAGAFSVLLKMAKSEPDPKQLKELLAQSEDDPTDLDALDQIWHEESVKFGGGKDEQRFGLDELRMELQRPNVTRQDPHPGAASGVVAQEN